jgi:hypothetical protein
MAKTAQLIDNGKVYYRVGIGLSKAEADRLATKYRRNGNLARVKKYKFGMYGIPYKWDVYSHGRRGLGNIPMGR